MKGMKMKFKKIEEGSSAQDFIKLKDKESVVGVFVGDLYEFHSIFENQKQREVSGNTPGAKFRFRVNFMVKQGPSFVPKIFENSATVYRQLEELHTEYDGLDSIFVKITRHGEKLDTTYAIMPSKQPLKDEEKQIIKSIKLHELRQKDQQPQQKEKGDHNEPPFDDDPPAFDSTDEIPF